MAESSPERLIAVDQGGLEQERCLPNQLRHLLEAAAGAEDEAWREFLHSYSRFILYVARQKARDRDDGVMDRYAFVVERLREDNYRRLRTFAADGRGKFTTWLMVVVRRLCLDHDRHRYGRTPTESLRRSPTSFHVGEFVQDPAAIDRIPDPRPSPDDLVEAAQGLHRLHAALATLTPDDRLLVSLRYEDGRSAREIASIMALPTPFHAYRRLRRVHRLLREALADRPEANINAGNARLRPPSVQYHWSGDGRLKPTA